MFNKRIIFPLVTGLLLAGCSAHASGAPLDLSKYHKQSVAWATCPANYFEPTDQLSKVFNKSRVQCGTVTVPAEYATGYSLLDFKIVMMRESASSSSKLGTLFVNPGGPGESGVKEIQWLNLPKQIRDS